MISKLNLYSKFSCHYDSEFEKNIFQQILAEKFLIYKKASVKALGTFQLLSHDQLNYTTKHVIPKQKFLYLSKDSSKD